MAKKRWHELDTIWIKQGPAYMMVWRREYYEHKTAKRAKLSPKKFTQASVDDLRGMMEGKGEKVSYLPLKSLFIILKQKTKVPVGKYGKIDNRVRWCTFKGSAWPKNVHSILGAFTSLEAAKKSVTIGPSLVPLAGRYRGPDPAGRW